MIHTEYSNEDGCTACSVTKSEVRTELGPENQAKLVFRLCAACRKELVDRLRPPEPEAKPKKPKA